MSRYASGVRVMRISPDAKVVTFAKAEHDDEEEIEAVDNTTSEEDVDVAELEALEKANEELDSLSADNEDIDEIEDASTEIKE